jgi:hypothetical protein
VPDSEDGSVAYEHAGTWDCECCDDEFEVEHKLDVLSHAFSCGNDVSHASRNEGYRRRKQELEQYSEGNR